MILNAAKQKPQKGLINILAWVLLSFSFISSTGSLFAQEVPLRIPEKEQSTTKSAPILKSVVTNSGSIEVAENATYNGYSPEQLVKNILVSGCLKAENVKFGYYYRGNHNYWGGWQDHAWSSTPGDRQLGYFNKGDSDFPLSEGLLLSTGKISSAKGPNDQYSETDRINEHAGDPSLEAIAGYRSYDASVLEFDFVPAGNTLEFKYVFASEEYREWVCSDFNDAFGFFLSGPGISGSVNLAKLPDNTPVTINNIRPNFTSAESNDYYYHGSTNCGSSNLEYYIDNGSGLSGDSNNSPTTQFDGMTVVLTATYQVQSCQTYHIKLAIADISDQQWDAGVFLEARSFNSNSANIYNIGSGIVGQTDIFESSLSACDNEIVIERTSGDNSSPVTFDLTYEGTAINGTDVVTLNGSNPLPSSVTIPAGSNSVSIPYRAVNDATSDNEETLIVKVAVGCPCDASTQYETITITIFDPIEISAVNTTNVNCENENSGSVEIIANGGTGNLQYSIDGTNYQSNNVFTGLETGNYTVYVHEGNNLNCEDDVTFNCTVGHEVCCTENVTPSSNSPVCSGNSLQLFANTIAGGSYSWTGPNNFTSSEQNPLINDVTTAASGVYTVTVNYGLECTSTETINVVVNATPTVQLEGTEHVCAGSNIDLNETSGDETIISWHWTGPNGLDLVTTTPSLSVPTVIGDNFSEFYVVTTSNGACTATDSIEVSVSSTPISMTGCSDDITVCADEIVNGELGSYVNWNIPDFELSCLGDESGDASFVMGFGLPEVKWDCWVFNQVQRVGNNSGVVNLWQSNQIDDPDPYILSPLVYIEPALDVNIDIYAETGENFDWYLVLVDTAGIEQAVGSVSITGNNSTSTYSINIPNTFSKGAYYLKFKFVSTGTKDPNKSVVDNIYFDAIILDLAGCEGGIEFTVAGPEPGFFPIIGDSTITYTATYTPSSGDPIIETCSFNVTVEGIEAQSSSTDATCGEDNGTITINSTVYTSTPDLEYSLNGGSWTSFAGTSTTITDLAAGNYTINVRDVSLQGDCEILNLLHETITAIPVTNVMLSEAGPFCEDDDAITLDGSPAGGQYYGNGVDSNGLFTPANASIGPNTIKYIYTDGNGCADSATIIIQVNELPTLQINPVDDLCDSETSYQIIATPDGGTFSGPAVTSSGVFSPNNAGVGTHTITYSFTDSRTGCSDSETVSITVLESTEETIQVSGCDSVVVNDITYYASGTYNQNLQNVAGCDSTLTILAIINDTYTADETTPVKRELCEADFEADGFAWGDSTWTAAGSKDVVFSTINGCDSIVTVNLIINDTYTADETTPVKRELCEADFLADGFAWGDSTWTAAGSKDVVFSTINGCDSIVTVNLIINDTYTADETTPVKRELCEADFEADGFAWGDSTWTTAGSKDVVFSTINGCDSIVTVNLIINDTYTADETTPVKRELCEADFEADGFSWGDSTWTAAGSKDVVFSTINGCDSIVTVNLIINDTYTADETTPVKKELCEADFEADGFSWGDSTWTTAGSKDVVFSTINGCDSIVTVNLIINDTYTADETTPVKRELCEADFEADGFAWGDSTWTTAGSKDVVFSTINGCDSIVTVNLIINDTYTADETTPVKRELCEADFEADGFSWGDSTWTAAGSKDVVFSTINGCDSIVTVNLIINDTYTADETTPVKRELCEADFEADGFAWGDSTWTAAGSKDVVFSTINGCDSIVTVNLIINDTYTADETTPVKRELCEADFEADGFAWGDSTWTTAGSKDVVFSTINGCDSIVTVNLIINDTYTADETTPVKRELCEADFEADGFAWGDSTWTTAGSKDVVFSTINGCDSIVTVNLIINDTYTADETTPVKRELCEADFEADGFSWGDSTWTAAGSKDVVFSTINGCDSIVTVNLIINDTYTADETTPVKRELCEADFEADGFAWGDSTWTAAGSKDVVFSTINGCDSIVTVNLIINDTYTADETTPVKRELCEADFEADGFAWGDSTWTAAGSKDVVFSTINGCDSIVTVNLIINDTYTADETTPVKRELCEADFEADGFAWGDSTWTAAGSKDVVFSTINGCDSIVTVNLIINDTYTADETTPVKRELCEADFLADGFAWGDSTWTAAGSKDVVFSTINGCDSIVTVNLIINDTYTADETTPVKRELCEADFLADGFSWGDSTWTAAGSKDVVFSTINGCDSIVTVNLIINDTYTADETTPVKRELCEADFLADGFAWGDSTWTTAGSKDVVFSTINGCDSIVTVNLIINDTYTADETTPVKRELCEADFEADGFSWGDSTWTAAGSKDVVFSTINGCDSIVTVNLIINDTYTADETTPVKRELCEADFEADGFSWGDSTWTTAGSKDVVFSTINGCDSIVTVNLIINDTYTADETTPVKKELCEADFEADGFSWGDSTWTTAGSKDVVFSTINGCDSIVTVNLIINDTYTADETTPVKRELCEADFEADGFAWGDSTWTTAGSKDVVFSTINGCDSIVTVNLIINDTYTADETTPVKRELCEADFEADGFAWGDSTWTTAGSKDVVFSTINGCDSIVTVNLIINDTYTADETTPVKRELCEADFEADGFSWGDSTWTAAGSKDVVFSTINGCDSIVTVNLIINDTYTADETTPVKRELCEADFEADGFAWGDSTWTAAGSKDVVFSTINGCDSIVTVNLIINDTYTADETTPVKRELCEADFEADGFAWGDSTWTTAGSKDVVFSTINGCDSIVTVNLIINDTYTADETTPVKRELCEADFEADGFAWGDSTWTTAGSKDVVFSTINGCDSIVTVNLIINDTYTADETTPVKRELCEADFEADGFSWGDSTWTAAGSKDVVFSTINGCDSIVTVNLIINDTYTADETTPVKRELCEADFEADGFAWGDSTWTAAGSKDVVFSTINGCDSIVTVNLIINDTYTADETTPVKRELCEADFEADGFSWGDSTWTTAGSKDVVFSTINGCDSIVTVNLIINDTYTADETTPVKKELCEADFEADGFSWGDSTWTTAGSKDVVFSTINGCDSIVTVNLIINDTYTADETTPVKKELCEADFEADGFSWGDSTWTTAGSKDVVFSTINGCDSIVTVNLIINDTYTADETTPVKRELCEADFEADGFAWGDSTWTAAGSKDVVFSTINGCDSIVTVNLIINDTYTADETTPVKRELCEADFEADGFAWGDSTWTAAGSKDVVFSTINGCDSIVTVNLIINDTYTADETTPVKRELCEADFEADGFSWGDSTWTTAGSKDVVFSTINGCDSIVTVNLIINDTYTADETTPVKKELCEADFEADGFAWGDSTWTAAGSKDVVFSTINGCDSIVTVNLIINDTYTADETTPVKKELCEADFEADGFAWGDSTWTAAGSKDVVFSTINGCDSIVTVNLIINDTYTADETTPVKRELCEADFEADGFSWGDSTWTTAGSKDVVFSTINGCDSIVTVNLIINDTYTADETTPVKKELCEADFEADGFAWGDSTWTAAGSKDVVFSTINGCDSIVTVNLIINDTYTADETTPVKRELCEADFEADGFSWGDSTWTTAGSKDVVFSTINGCDSIVTVNLIINDTYTADETTPVKRELCEADFEADGFAWGDSTWTAAGSKDVVFSTINGCDSIVTVNLIINDTYTADETTPVKRELCEADFEADGFSWGDSTWTTAGSKDVVFSTINGCDSIVTVTLTVIESTFETISRTVCDQVTINDSTYNESGTYIQNLTNANGCDSTLTINLIVLDSPEDTIDVTTCDEYQLNDSVYTQSGTYTQVVESEEGCTGTITVNLTILESTQEMINQVVCDSYTLNGRTYTESGTYRQYTTNDAGCDSTIILNLTVREDIIELTNEASDLTVACDGNGNTDAFENWLATNGTTGSAQAGFGSVNWSNNFEALTPGCCNTGSATVTFTATDDCGNSVSTTATFTIIDTTAPAFTAPEDITIYSDAECNYDISVEATGDVTDETDACCDDLNAEYTDLVEQGACAGEWIITRTWTLADQCGNQAEPQVQLITVMDTIAPTAICSDITIQLDESGLATINAEDINGGSTDNCGIDTIFISQYNFTCDELGTNQVTLTVVDNCGNTSTCTATVTVESGEANCGSIQTTPDVLDIVVCNGREVSGTMNILDNDNLAGAGFTITANNLPQGVQLDLTTGELTYYSQQITETTIQFTYTVCHDVYTNDCSEALVTINVLIDTDCDGIHDAIDIDDDDDGILDVDEEAYSLNQQTLDSDGDGIVDRLDIDSDNDGIPDNIEWQQNIEEGIQYGSYAYGTDMGYDYFPPLGTDENGDGWDDRYDRDGVYYEPVDMDGDGTPDYLDTDSDGDGIEDWIEGWDAMPHDTIADTDIVYTDSDGDGLDDAYDSYDTSQEWLHGLNAIGSYAPLQDMAADTANNIRDWRDIIEPPEDIDDQQAEGCELNIPDGFSPNQDGYNDFFEMRFTCDTGEQLFEDVYPEAKIEIFNRWGNLVYEQENYGNVSRWGSTDAWWDGTSMHDMQIGNDKLPAATYFYILYLNNGQEAITGTIFLNN